jgi:hypothetical protein
MTNRPLLLLFVLILIGTHWGFAQNRWVEIKYSDFSKSAKCKLGNGDSVALSKAIQRCLFSLHEKGFIAARVDSVRINNSQRNVYATRGPQFRWVITNSDSLTAQWLGSLPISMAKLHKKPVRPSDISLVSNSFLSHFENRGYPFSTFTLNPLRIDSSTITITPTISPGQLITWDTLIIKGNVKIDHRFMSRYLGFKPNGKYSEALVKGSQVKINALNFVATIRQPEVEFTPHKASLYLYLNSNRASRFSGLVGFSSDANSQPKLKLTGDINLLLRNAFRKGEELSMKWNALGEGSQRLNMFTSWPYIAGTAYGIEAHFKMHKQDTAYLNINPRVAVAVFSAKGLVAGVGFEVKQSKVLRVQQQSNFSNFSTYLYQFNVKNWQQTPSEFPLPGLWYDAQIGAGWQYVSGNPNRKRNSVLNAKGGFSLVLPIVQRYFLIKLSSISEANYRFSGENIATSSLSNDLVRIGGSDILRGFNQESIATDRFTVGSLEFHFIAQQKFSLFTFTDKAIVSQRMDGDRVYSWPQGIGIGSLLMVGNGVLKFNYAVGQGFGEEFQLRNAKVHIGYTTNF